MNETINLSESRAKREDKECDIRAVVDACRDGLIDKDEARAMMGFRDDEQPADEDHKDEDHKDEDTRDDEAAAEEEPEE